MEQREQRGLIERGRVASVAGEGWTVESLDRPGIVSPPLGSMDPTLWAQGDRVLFVLFGDGSGKILCAM